MKSLKFILMAAAAFVGISAAVAANSRLEFYYTNDANNGVYSRVLPSEYDLSYCGASSQYPCTYTLTVLLGSTALESEILANGGVPSSSWALYRR